MGRLAILALILSACGVPAQPDLSASAPTAPPLPSAPQPAGDRLYIRDGLKGDAERLAVVDSVTGARERDLPSGLVAPDWSTLYVVEADGDKTLVRAIDAASGKVLRSTAVDAAYELPAITPDSIMGGLSPNGRWLALVAKQPGAGRTRFVVLDTGFGQAPKEVELSGSFQFDGLSDGGQWLFLTESLGDDPTAKYQVRRYDLRAGALDPQVIVEKGEQTGTMSGARISAVASKRGDWLYSLYLDADHGPFIHALPISDGAFAFCIDLPITNNEDLAQQSRWSLVLSGDQRTLYAVNGALGLVVEHNVSDGVPQVARSKTLFKPPVSVAGGAATVRTSTVTMLAPDGRTLYTLGDGGMLVIDTGELKLRGRYLADWKLDGLAISPDGARLYAASAAQGKIVRLDPAAGTIAAEVPATGSPTGIVRVAART
jgi:hypothetical protein